jgi:hypothetical protein
MHVKEKNERKKERKSLNDTNFSGGNFLQINYFFFVASYIQLAAAAAAASMSVMVIAETHSIQLTPPDLSLPQGETLASQGIAIAPSSIPKAGHGLFATRAFRANELITRYSGHIGSADDARACARFSVHLVSHVITIDGAAIFGPTADQLDANQGAGSIANHRERGQCNARFYKCASQPGSPTYGVWLRASRDIVPGEEIFVFYGNSYWRRRNESPTR